MTERHRLPNQQQSTPAMTAAEMIERAATISIAPFVSLDEAAADINAEFRRVVDAHEKLMAARIRCGVKLLALRARIEAGEAGDVTWWAWYESKFARSRRDAEKVMELAAAENPVAAHEAEKAATRERMRIVRSRPAPSPGPRDEPCAPERVETRSTAYPMADILSPEVLPPEIQHDLLSEGLTVFRRMNRTTQRRYFVELRNAYRER